jgi:oligoendopeptidase F
MYRAIEEGRYLDYSTICGLWTDARDRIFGDAVKWLPEMGAEWTMKPHYYMANFRFYNYPYVYAQLFVFAAYQQYLKEGKNFVPKMVEALSSGSSVSPKRIGEILGLDTESSDFWKLGMNQIETFLKELEEIISE